MQFLRVAALVLSISTAAHAGQFELLSKAGIASETADSPSLPASAEHPAALSADGRWIAFVSQAENLVAGQQDRIYPSEDIFLHDRVAGTTVLASHVAGAPSVTGNFHSTQPGISADGRWVVYLSGAGDLTVPAQAASDWRQVYLYDRDTGTNTLVSHSTAGPTVRPNGPASQAAISADGDWIVFASWADDLMPGLIKAPGSELNVFLYERATGDTTLVSRASGTTEHTANSSSFGGSISADGRWVAFMSLGTNLVSGTTGGGNTNVYLFDRDTGTMTLVSHTSASALAMAEGVEPVISADGSAVAFLSYGTGLVAGQVDTNGTRDVFLFDRASGVNALVSRSAASLTTTGDEGATWPIQVAADGAYVAFLGSANDAVAGQSEMNSAEDVFLFDRATSSLTLVTRSSASATTTLDRPTFRFHLAGNGSFVVFENKSTNVVAGQSDTAESADVFLFDRAAGTCSLVSGAGGSGQTTAGGESTFPAISADGAWITFFTEADDLVPGIFDYNLESDLILQDRAAGTSGIVTVHAPGMASITPGAGATLASVSADGRYAVYVSHSVNVLAGQTDTNGSTDVFLVDQTAGTTTLVSRSPASAFTTGDGGSGSAVISADGAYVVFASAATDLVPGQVDSNSDTDVFLYDRAAGTTALVSHAAGSQTTTGNRYCSQATLGISADGRYVAFSCPATDLVAGMIDNNFGNDDLFLYDRVSGQVTLVSHAAGSATTTGNSESSRGVLSPDGRYVAYTSYSSDLVAGATYPPNSAPYVFLYDRDSGQTTLVSRAAGTAATAGNGPSYMPALSGDGRFVAFASESTNLVPGQTDSQDNFSSSDVDVFLFDRSTGAVELISRLNGSATAAANQYSISPRLSGDGRYAAFLSSSTQLVPGVTDPGPLLDVFVHDRVLRTTELISRSMTTPNGPLGPQCDYLEISPDGRFVTFVGSGRYVFDRQTRILERFSGGVDSGSLMSADGSVLFFTSGEQRVAEADRNEAPDVMAYVRTPPAGSDFHTVAPCRLIQGVTITNWIYQTPVHGLCGIPDTATAIAVNVTAVQPNGPGRLTLHPGNVAAPVASTLNFKAGNTRGNNAIVPLALNGEGTLAITPFVAGMGSVGIIVDVTGYFE